LIDLNRLSSAIQLSTAIKTVKSLEPAHLHSQNKIDRQLVKITSRSRFKRLCWQIAGVFPFISRRRELST